MTTQTIKPHFTVRHFQRDRDIPHLVQFAIDAEGRKPEETAAIKIEIEESFTWEGHDPERDRYVVMASDNATADNATIDNVEVVVAQAVLSLQLQERILASIVVHPAWRRRDIGSMLLERVRTRARAYNASHIALGHKINNAAGQAFLQHHNFQLAGHIRTFMAPADVAIPAPEWPTGFIVRQFEDVQSFATLATAQNRCYHDMWGQTENTKGAITEEVLAEYLPRHPEFFNAAGVHLVFAPDGEAVGICYGNVGRAVDGQRQQIIDSPGIAPEYRHLELQRPLMLCVMRWLRQTYGAGSIDLQTYGDYDPAVEIYQELGFRLVPEMHHIDYRWDLR